MCSRDPKPSKKLSKSNNLMGTVPHQNPQKVGWNWGIRCPNFAPSDWNQTNTLILNCSARLGTYLVTIVTRYGLFDCVKLFEHHGGFNFSDWTIRLSKCRVCVAWLSDVLQAYTKLKPDDLLLKIMESCTELGQVSWVLGSSWPPRSPCPRNKSCRASVNWLFLLAISCVVKTTVYWHHFMVHHSGVHDKAFWHQWIVLSFFVHGAVLRRRILRRCSRLPWHAL